LERTILDNIIPRIEHNAHRIARLENDVRELDTKFSTPPKIDAEITGATADYVIENAKKIYEAFGARNNFALKIVLSETADN